MEQLFDTFDEQIPFSFASFFELSVFPPQTNAVCVSFNCTTVRNEAGAPILPTCTQVCGLGSKTFLKMLFENTFSKRNKHNIRILSDVMIVSAKNIQKSPSISNIQPSHCSTFNWTWK